MNFTGKGSSLLEQFLNSNSSFGFNRARGVKAISSNDVSSLINAMSVLSSNNSTGSPIIAQLNRFYSSRVQLIDEVNFLDPSHPVISSVLDQYADSIVTIPNTDIEADPFYCKGNKKAVEAAEGWLRDNGINSELWEHARHLCKFGEIFFLLKKKNNGVISLSYEKNPKKYMAVKLQGENAIFDTELSCFAQSSFDYNAEGKRVNKDNNQDYAKRIGCKDIQIVHVKLPSRTDAFRTVELRLSTGVSIIVEHDTGCSILEPVIAISRIIDMIEDTLLMTRIEKSKITRIYEVEMGDTPNEKSRALISKIKQLLKGRSVLNTVTKDYQQSNVSQVMQEIVVPVKNGVGAINVKDIDSVFKSGDLDDLDYFTRKFYSGVKISKVYLGYEESSPGGLNTDPLAKIEQKFGKAVRRVIFSLERGLNNCVKAYSTMAQSTASEVTLTLYKDRTLEELESAKNLETLARTADTVIRTITNNDNQINKELVTKSVTKQLLPNIHDLVYLDDNGKLRKREELYHEDGESNTY